MCSSDLAKLGRTMELPKKVTASGEAAPERKPRKGARAVEEPVAEIRKPHKEPAARGAEAKPAEIRKPRFGPGAENRAPDMNRTTPLPKGGQAVRIGRDGKLQAAEKPARSAAEAGKQPMRPALAKPVKRVNRSRGQNGKRG